MLVSGSQTTVQPTGYVTRITTVVLSPDGLVKSQHTTEHTTSFPTATEPSSPKAKLKYPKPVHRPTQSLTLPKLLKKPLKLAVGNEVSREKKRVWKGLLERCEKLEKEVMGQWCEATKSVSTRREEWAKAKKSASKVSHKTAWRHSHIYKRKRAEIEMQTKTWDNLAKDSAIILNITSPEVSPHSRTKEFVKIEDLTPSRMRSLGLVSKRSFGGKPLARLEVVRNIEKLHSPGLKETGSQTHLVSIQRKRQTDLSLSQANIEKKPTLFITEEDEAASSNKRSLRPVVKNRKSIRKSLTEAFISTSSVIL